MYLKHGLSNTPEYKCWQQIKARCLSPKHRAYPDYGGRGITIFEEWANDFQSFLSHVGPRPSDRHSLDRIDNSRGYAPGNVHWATSDVQTANQRPHRKHGVRSRRPTRSDGKPTNFKHGLIHTSEYSIWLAMKDRCLNPKSSNYSNWGGRGIGIFDPWIHDFMAFYAYVGPRPSPQHSLDRWPDLNGNYEPSNVRWATKFQQTENRRPCKTGPEHGNHKHGHTQTPTYKVWASIKTRCFNSKHGRYPSYGGVGITMCRRWRESFEAFLEDLGSKPDGRNLSRLIREGHYSCGKCPECLARGWPANCRWATKTEINRSRRASSRSGKLTPESVQQIRQMIAAKAPHPEIAAVFGIGRSLVGKIGRGEAWA